jgi:N-acetylmuramoyl-L-alanine amidase
MSSWLSKLAFITRSAASYGALAVAVTALGWLALRLEAVPKVQIRPWELESAPLIIVDAGHGGQDGGAVAGGLIEKNLSLTLARQLRDHLQDLGLRVKMTRDSDVFIELAERSQIAAEAKAALFVSLHLNTSETPSVSGIETYYAEQKSLAARRTEKGTRGRNASERLARSLQQQACLAAKAEDRGIKAKNYAVVTHTPCPAVLIECGFLTHAEEVAKLKRADYQKDLTRGIAAGVAEFLKTQPALSTGLLESPLKIEPEAEVKVEAEDL